MPRFPRRGSWVDSVSSVILCGNIARCSSRVAAYNRLNTFQTQKKFNGSLCAVEGSSDGKSSKCFLCATKNLR